MGKEHNSLAQKPSEPKLQLRSALYRFGVAHGQALAKQRLSHRI
jgi:hypothetical protein